MGFQADAFQNDAFQIEVGAPVTVIPGWEFHIGGTERTAYARTANVEITYTFGSRGVLRMEVLDTQADTETAYRPNVDEEVIVLYAGVLFFVGTVLSVSDRALGDPGIGVVTTITAVDRARVTDQRLVNHTYAAGMSPKQILEHLILNYLSVYNITLDPAMYTWGALTSDERFTYDAADTATTVLNRIADIFLTPWRITPANVLEMFVPGTKETPYWLSVPTTPPYVGFAGTLAQIHGGISWSRTRSNYVNRQYLKAGPSTVIEKTETFPPASGFQTVWNLSYPASPLTPNLRGYITVDGVVTPISIYGDGGPEMYQFNAAAGPNGYGAIWSNPSAPDGTVVSVTYDAQLPFVVMAEDAAEVAAHGPFEAMATDTTILDAAVALERVQMLLQRNKTIPRELTIETDQIGLVLPGDQLPLTAPQRVATGFWMVMEVQIRPLLTSVAQGVRTTMRCLEGNTDLQRRSWIDYFRSRLR
jgi:hypothetical protein